MNLLAEAHTANAQAAAPLPVTSESDADALAMHYIEVMDSLLDVVQQETALVRAGSFSKATALEPSKTELARLYVADTLRLRANRTQMTQIAPQTMPELIRRHNDFRSLLQVNLTVLATAHAVSEGIVRGVSDELVRKASPETYGATGRTNTPGPRTAQPLAVSRAI